MVTVQLELSLSVLGDKYLLKKKIQIPREPVVGEMVQVSLVYSNGDNCSYFVTVKNKKIMTEGDEFSRYVIDVDSKVGKSHFVNAAIVETGCNWEVFRV